MCLCQQKFSVKIIKLHITVRENGFSPVKASVKIITKATIKIFLHKDQ
jgi:hypothetical protein